MIATPEWQVAVRRRWICLQELETVLCYIGICRKRTQREKARKTKSYISPIASSVWNPPYEGSFGVRTNGHEHESGRKLLALCDQRLKGDEVVPDDVHVCHCDCVLCGVAGVCGGYVWT